MFARISAEVAHYPRIHTLFSNVPGMPIPFELTLTAGPALERARWRIDRRLCIGRADTCQLVLAEARISRQHAIIEADVEGWMLRDCRSALGTRLNGLELPPDIPAALHVADVIAIGAWRFRVDLDTELAGSARRVGESAESACNPRRRPQHSGHSQSGDRMGCRRGVAAEVIVVADSPKD